MKREDIANGVKWGIRRSSGTVWRVGGRSVSCLSKCAGAVLDVGLGLRSERSSATGAGRH